MRQIYLTTGCRPKPEKSFCWAAEVNNALAQGALRQAAQKPGIDYATFQLRGALSIERRTLCKSPLSYLLFIYLFFADAGSGASSMSCRPAAIVIFIWTSTCVQSVNF